MPKASLNRPPTPHRSRLCLFASGGPMANSSILRPLLRAAVSQRGCFPRPDQVSEGLFGLTYLGTTLGYLRRTLRVFFNGALSPSRLSSPAQLRQPFLKLPLFRVQPNRQNPANFLMQLPHVINRHRVKVQFLAHNIFGLCSDSNADCIKDALALSSG